MCRAADHNMGNYCVMAGLSALYIHIYNIYIYIYIHIYNVPCS